MERKISKFEARAADVSVNGRKPIVYDRPVTVRFGDLDPYNHLNAGLYLDYIGSSRLSFLEEKFDLSIKTLVERGIGFYLKKSTQLYKRPVVGLVDVRCLSFVEQSHEASLVIPYSLEDGVGRVYSEGSLEYVIIDLKVGGPCKIPDWLCDVFFETKD